MHALRRSTVATSFALCWFVLVLAAGIASPMLREQTLELLCSSTGPSKFIVIGNDEHAVPAGLGGHALDCPLCLAAVLPPTIVQSIVGAPAPQFEGPSTIYVCWIAALRGAPLPARGPPRLRHASRFLHA